MSYGDKEKLILGTERYEAINLWIAGERIELRVSKTRAEPKQYLVEQVKDKNVVSSLDLGVFENVNFEFKFPVQQQNAQNSRRCQVKIAKNIENEQLCLLVIYKMGQKNEKKFFSKVP